jgi:hypothetical protein
VEIERKKKARLGLGLEQDGGKRRKQEKRK